jgi:anti-sigma factor RsiW
MDHQEAVLAQAAERYLLGEMAVAEREAFEEHFFVCDKCADALADGATLADNVRALFKEQELRHEQPHAGLWQRLRTWSSARALWPVFATAALLLFAGYLEIVRVPALQRRLASATAPQAIVAFALHAASRGAAQVIAVPTGARFYTIFVDLPPGNAEDYRCEIRDASGTLHASLAAPRSDTSDTLNLLLETSRTPQGDYTLVVRTGRTEISRYNFTVQFK